MLFDSASLTLPFICFGLYSQLPLQIVQILASLPFLFMIFFSTTFSPGAGVPGVKVLRYLFARFYLWCRVPGAHLQYMEGCPEDDMLVGCTIASGCLGMVLFVIFQLVRVLVVRRAGAAKTKAIKETISSRPEFAAIQAELYKNAAPAPAEPQAAHGTTCLFNHVRVAWGCRHAGMSVRGGENATCEHSALGLSRLSAVPYILTAVHVPCVEFSVLQRSGQEFSCHLAALQLCR